ncbi:hypothetical protein HHL28_10240 [Aerophototrophica crusticola]|uniref:Uncharacterized protein n=1 Tax=Aerophototrophica crusticola TaxID=1709002 RepID=A0A858R769_9PROT|nr:hypothetical protein HHL28_10240 [Rhodospirillaceae bacterium B3]
MAEGGQAAQVLGTLMPMYARDTWGMTDEERDAFLDKRSQLTWLLAQLPAHGPAQLQAKLEILCRRLRLDLPQGGVTTDYLLAESARADAAALAGMGG